MGKRSYIAVALSLFLAGAGYAAEPEANPIVAQIGSGAAAVSVTRDELIRPLIDGYGLNVLLNLIQLNMAKAGAAKVNVVVTPQDIANERRQTIDEMFKDSNQKQLDKAQAAEDKGDRATAEQIRQQIQKDNDSALDQFLQNQHISRAEFDIVTETNAYLRKQAAPLLQGKISEENLQQAFATEYGETLQCRHIQCANVQEINEAKRKLAGGEDFAQVAQEMSRNPGTRPLGGMLPPFSLQTPGLPQAFKDAANTLKAGEVSDIVQADGNFHLIKLEKRIPPKVVKFEDVKESIRQDLYERAMKATVKQLRQQLADQAVKFMVITDPTLKAKWDQLKDKRQGEIKSRDQLRKQLEDERENATTQPTTTGSR